ncbi:MAG: hypothetical protein IJE71_06760 [Clostridia bacterium]|nr:hypothetical protein [Clostridia bacterium]MBQ4609445.1 hypothetical protein [Clostridia bacterium]
MRLPFSGRIERAQKFSGEQAKQRRGRYDDELAPADIMEKGDGLAMLLAALITIVPVCLVVLALLAGAGYFFLIR